MLGRLPGLDLRHPWHAKVEDRFRQAKATGLQITSRDYAIKHRVVSAVAIGLDLLAWTGLLALEGDLAKAEPATCVTASCRSVSGSCAAGAVCT